MNPVRGIPLLLAALGSSQDAFAAPPDEVGGRTEAAYRSLLKNPKPVGSRSKLEWLRNETERYYREGTPLHPFKIPASETPRLVALLAIGLETGRYPIPSEPIRKALEAYPASVRRRWSPFAQRLWAEASYDWRTSDPSTVRTQISTLRAREVDMDALEAASLGLGAPKSKDRYARAEMLLAYAEGHPKDIMGAMRAATALYVPTFGAVDRGQPVRRDLIDRVFALEARVLRSRASLIGEPGGRLQEFDLLRVALEPKHASR